MQSDDVTPESKGFHVEDDGSTVVVAAAAAAKSLGVDRPVVDPRHTARSAANEVAIPATKPDATRDATRDAPVPLVDGARCVAEGGAAQTGDGRREALTDKAHGNGTKAPTRKKQGEPPVLDPTREAQRQERKTANAMTSKPAITVPGSCLERTFTGVDEPVQKARIPCPAAGAR